MFLSAQKVINTPVAETARAAAGTIRGFFVDAKTGKIWALQIDKERFVLFLDVKNFFKDQIVLFPASLRLIAKDSKMVERKEENVRILGNQAVTESGKVLGEVKDFTFDDISGKIVKYYVKAPLVHNLFKGQLIIDQSQIIALKKEMIIVKDNLLAEKGGLKIFSKKEQTLPAGAAVAHG